MMVITVCSGSSVITEDIIGSLSSRTMNDSSTSSTVMSLVMDKVMHFRVSQGSKVTVIATEL